MYKSVSKKYLDRLLKDKDYIKLYIEYNKTKEINPIVLSRVLRHNIDILYIVLKCSINTFKLDISNLKKDSVLKDYKHHYCYDSKVTRDIILTDADIVFKYYYNNQDFIKSIFEVIIKKKYIKGKELEIIKDLYYKM